MAPEPDLSVLTEEERFIWNDLNTKYESAADLSVPEIALMCELMVKMGIMKYHGDGYYSLVE